MAFRKIPTAIPDLYLIEPDVFGDRRGFFLEMYNSNSFKALELFSSSDNDAGTEPFVQDNLSFSRRGTLRGLHFQRPPYAQAKLVSVLQGEVLDVAVDIRKGSPTYGQHIAVVLSAENHRMLFIPEGFAHGFQVLSEECLFFYKCSNFYHQPSDSGLMWNDPDLKVQWRTELDALLSDKDQRQLNFRSFESPFAFAQ